MFFLLRFGKVQTSILHYYSHRRLLCTLVEGTFFWRERDSVFESFGALFTLSPAVISPLFLLWKVNLPFSSPPFPLPRPKREGCLINNSDLTEKEGFFLVGGVVRKGGGCRKGRRRVHKGSAKTRGQISLWPQIDGKRPIEDSFCGSCFANDGHRNLTFTYCT